MGDSLLNINTMGYDIYFYRNEFIPKNEIIQSSVKTINPSNQRTIKESILDLSGWELINTVLSDITNDDQNEGELELEDLIGVIQTLIETGKFHYTDEFGFNLIKQLQENHNEEVFYSYSQSY